MFIWRNLDPQVLGQLLVLAAEQAAPKLKERRTPALTEGAKSPWPDPVVDLATRRPGPSRTS